MAGCKCGGTDIEYDHSRGDATCMSCGAVLSENQIVTELGFVENAAGVSSMVGQFVPASGMSQLGAGAKLSRPGTMFGTESREVTISRGKFKIQSMAMSLNMNKHHVEAAHRLFVLAVQHNFTQGRKTDHVVAACLYIVCRREKTQHMLIDFSDILQENVYILGKTYLKFIRVLNLTMPIIDPSLFVHRFAARMELEEKTHAVSMTALRLIARMRRDWMAIGRRPAGICGAALMIAAKIHGFRRSQKEVGRIIKMCEATLRKRVMEFIDTPSSHQTVAEFHESPDDFAIEMDPPAFRCKVYCSKTELCSKKGEPEEDEESQLEADARKEIDDEMRQALKSNELRSLENEFHSTSCTPAFSSNDKSPSERPISPPLPSITGGDPANFQEDREEQGYDVSNEREKEADSEGEERNQEVDENGRVITEESLSSESDDEELARMVLSVDEQICKEKIWTEVNKDYLREQEIKRKWEEDQIAMGIEPDSVRRKRRRTKTQNTAKTPAEATLNALSNKKSAKINYDILKDLFDSAPVHKASSSNADKGEEHLASEIVGEDDGDIIEDGEDEALEIDDELMHRDYGEDDLVDELYEDGDDY